MFSNDGLTFPILADAGPSDFTGPTAVAGPSAFAGPTTFASPTRLAVSVVLLRISFFFPFSLTGGNVPGVHSMILSQS
jgi:hypothetical protein